MLTALMNWGTSCKLCLGQVIAVLAAGSVLLPALLRARRRRVGRRVR